MTIPVLAIIVLVLAILVLLLLHLFRTQRAAVISIYHLVSNMSQGQYARRTDPLVKGAVGELARAANALAENLETRSAKAQQDQDFLTSLLALLDHTNEIALAT